LWQLGGGFWETVVMRLFLVPLVAYTFVLPGQSDEPTERAMRIAFEQRLQMQVSNALEFLTETGGLEAVTRVRRAGMDHFEVRNFRKLDCSPDNVGFYCSFEVDVSLVTGAIEQKISGRFRPGPDGRLTFVQDI
jgi:hypothetical protein